MSEKNRVSPEGEVGPRRRAVMCFAAGSAAWMAAAATYAQGNGGAASMEASDRIAMEYMRGYDVPGMSLAIGRNGRVITERAYGFSDVQTRTPVASSSRFRIASLSKALTSAAVFKLVEAGRLDLSDAVFAPDGILPQFAGLGGPLKWLPQVTVRHLLTHTEGGWPNDANDPMFRELELNQSSLIAHTLRTRQLDHEPGSTYAYSNFGYCVLGRVIEQRSGLPYEEFVRRNVLMPARSNGMAIGGRKPLPGEVRYYPQNGGDPYAFDVSRMDAHGGWVATAGDLVRCVGGMFAARDRSGSPEILTKASLDEATDGTAANPWYGCGWLLNAEGNCWHIGSLPGTTTLMVHTATGLSWAALLNASSATQGAAIELEKMMWRFVKSSGA